MMPSCPQCDAPIEAELNRDTCAGCGCVLDGAGARAIIALRRVERVLGDPAVPTSVAEQAGALVTARRRALEAQLQQAESRPIPGVRSVINGAPAEAAPDAPAQAVAAPIEPAPTTPTPIKPAHPSKPRAPTLWERLGPAFAEHVLFLVGGLLLLVGAAYFASTAWTTMTGATRLLVVEGGLLVFAGMLAGLGRLLNRDGRLQDLEQVVRPLAGGVATLAAVAAGRLWAVDGLWAVLGGLVAAAGVGLAGRWAGGPIAGGLAAGFAALAWLVPWVSSWPLLTVVGLVGALVFVAPRIPAAGAAVTPVLAWCMAVLHLLVLVPEAHPVVGLALSGLGLAWVRRRVGQPAGAADRLALALAVGGAPVALGDPVVALAAAATGAVAAGWLGVRRGHRAAWAMGLALAFVAYVLAPAPLKALLAPLRSQAAAGLGYGSGRLPLAWYAMTCVPYLLVVGGLARRLSPPLVRLTAQWLGFLGLSLAVLAGSGPDLRPAAIGWALEGLALTGIGVWLAQRWLAWAGLALLVLAVPVAATVWGAPLGAVAAGWALMAWAVHALGARAPSLAPAARWLMGLAAAAVAVRVLGLVEWPWPTTLDAAALVAAAALLWRAEAWAGDRVWAGWISLGAVLALVGPARWLAWQLDPTWALAVCAAVAAVVLVDPRKRPVAWVVVPLLLGGVVTPIDGWGLAVGGAGAFVVLLGVAQLISAAWPAVLAGLLPAVVVSTVVWGYAEQPELAALSGLLAVALTGALRWTRAHRAVHGPAPLTAGLLMVPALGLSPDPWHFGALGGLLLGGMALAPRLHWSLNGAWAALGGFGVTALAVGLTMALGDGMGLFALALAGGTALITATARWWPGGVVSAHRVAGVLLLGVATAGLLESPELGLQWAALALGAGVAVAMDGRIGAVLAPALTVLGLAGPGVLLLGYPEAWGLAAVVATAGVTAFGALNLRGFRKAPTVGWGALVALAVLVYAGGDDLWLVLRGVPRPVGPGWIWLAWTALAGVVIWRARWRGEVWLLATVPALTWYAPITAWAVGAPDLLVGPSFELVLLGGIAAVIQPRGRITYVAAGVGVLAWTGAWTQGNTLALWSLATGVFILRAWRSREALDRGVALWLAAFLSVLGAAWALELASIVAMPLWPFMALALAVVGLASGPLKLRGASVAMAGAVAVVLLILWTRQPVPWPGAAAYTAAGGAAAWLAWRRSAETPGALWVWVVAVAATHGALAQTTTALALLSGHHLEVWSAGALLVVVLPAMGPRGRAARQMARWLVWPALLLSGDADGLSRAAALAALVYGAAARRAEAPYLRWAALGFANVAVAAVWAGHGVIDPAFYGLPVGLTLVAVAELDRVRLGVRAHVALLSVGLMVGYGAVAAQILRVGSVAHAAVLFGLGLATLAAGWRWQRGVLLIAGAAATVLAATGHLIRAGFQRGFTGAGVLLVAGLVVLVAGAVAARRRR
jgi:hypothetical protein